MAFVSIYKLHEWKHFTLSEDGFATLQVLGMQYLVAQYGVIIAFPIRIPLARLIHKCLQEEIIQTPRRVLAYIYMSYL